jgi:hypothetical protein
MCATCAAFSAPVELASAAQLDDLVAHLHRDGVATGVLEVVDGSLAWDDHVECLLVCRLCGGRFRLSCETYHGLGGRFERLA